jgi:hypothetical protein
MFVVLFLSLFVLLVSDHWLDDSFFTNFHDLEAEDCAAVELNLICHTSPYFISCNLI